MTARMFEGLAGAIAAPFQRADVRAIDPEVLQPLSLLLDLAGEGLRTQLFVVQSDAGEEMALRPDFTIPVARAHVASGEAGGAYRYNGTVFLAPADTESPEPSEFRQIGMERFGDQAAIEADAEMVAIAWQSACAGGSEGLILTLGSVDLFAHFLTSLELPGALDSWIARSLGEPQRLRRVLDNSDQTPFSSVHPLIARLGDLTEDDAQVVLSDLWTLAGVSPTGSRPASEILRRLSSRAKPGLSQGQRRAIRDYLEVRGDLRASLDRLHRLVGDKGGGLGAVLEAWSHRVARLADLGIPAGQIEFAAGFGRPFGYYDGLMFEIVSKTLGEKKPLAAGGRYDGLLKRLGGQGCGVGCMVRPARILAGAPS